ncbi:MAG: efflux RND transporter permease subunit [Gemmataceae bacterium]
MNIVRAALGNVYAVAVLALLILVLGLLAVASIPVDILPAFKTPAVQVLTYYGGMPTSSVEKTITNRIERWVNQAPGAANVESRSVPGVSIARVIFRDEIDPNAALTMTSALALSTLPTLPPNTLPPVSLPYDPTGTLPLGILTVRNPRFGEARIKDLARIDVRNMLGTVPGSVAPVAVGGQDRTVLIYLDPDRLQARNLSPLDVVKALQEGNLMVTPGAAYFGDNQVLLDTNMMVANVDELNEIPVRIRPGDNVYLRDVGHAEDAAAIQTARVRIDGKRQVFVPIYRQGGASSLRVVNDVKTAIPSIEDRLPEGTKLDFVMDQSEGVRKAIHSLIEEGFVGGCLVGVMILVFLGNWRMTLIAVLSLPLAILAAIVGLYATGNTINVMTLGGLFLAIGPLVDDAIVVLENVHRHMSMGKSPVRAAYDGTVEVSIPVLVATCTTVIVLCPVALMPGLGGFLFKPLAIAVAFAMFSSFLLSRTFVPALCSKLLQAHRLHSVGFWGRLYGRFDATLNWFNRLYGRVLNVALHHRTAVLVTGFGLFAASLTLFPRIGQEFFPQVDAGQIAITVQAPSTSRLDATERRVAEVEQFIEQFIPPDERKMIVSEIGLNPDWSAAYTQNAGQQDAYLRVQLTEERTKSAQQYAIDLRHAIAEDPRFSDLRISFDTGGMVTAALNFGASSPIDVQITGGTIDQAMNLARQIRGRVVGVRGTADVRVQQRADAPYLILDVDRVKAASVGLSARDVVMQVVAAMNSSTSIARNFWIDTKSGNQYFVAVQYPEDPGRTISDLQSVVATGTNQSAPVQLGSLVNLRSSTASVEINHAGLQRVINVQVNTEGRDIGHVAADIEKALKDLTVPKGMRVELRGEYARMTASFKSLGFGLALATVLVYLILVPLMRSFVGPLIILFTVPLGLIGVLTMLYLTGTTLNVMSEVGVIFLVGIVVSNGVLLMDFANQLRRGGATVRDAIVQAASTRFRPILMTFLATFLDLLPMAIGLGKGSESITPLARAVVGGLLTSTFLTLIIIPVLYTLLIRERRGPEPDLDTELTATVPHPPVHPMSHPHHHQHHRHEDHPH